ncbi:NAD(P)/FAD-dependent oxidoreductase [Pseudactinotalea sp.]|uniref:NAD(P)/FAD-dependent oxidoreductase n=1 Tax=Pseudactinotalea sp. TaxID=1926260 RepID=UPI003B3AECA4
MTTPRTLTAPLDALVIGGGAAGLAGAITLARSRRSVLVVDGGAPRNAPADGVHALLALDGIAPADLVARGREEVARYGGDVVTAEVSDAAIEGDGFAVTLGDGTVVRARRLLVATGAVDVLPEIPGLAEHWGRSVVHCPYCHGWEVRDQPIGVIASHPMFTHQALLFRQLSSDVVVFTHGVDPTPEQRAQLLARGIGLVEDGVSAIRAEAGAVTGVELADGRVVPRSVLTVQSVLRPRIESLTGLGLTVAENPMGTFVPTTDIGGRSEVPGVWLAGNVTEPAAQVGASAAAGTMAGAQINADLVMAETAAAVAAM